MTIRIDNETDIQIGFEYESLLDDCVRATLESFNCPYETEVDIVLTGNEGIRDMNRRYRGMDSETDVLSFPMIEYVSPACFDSVKNKSGFFDLGTKELLLGDIMISVDKAYGQAEAYGHSREREFAFLAVHGVLHLLGYDHGTEEEQKVMEEMQEGILEKLGILR